MNCYLSLGANLGERKKNIRNALELIAQIDGVEVMAVSSFYESEAWGVKNQPDFINAAARIRSTLSPLSLLTALQLIEHQLGRVRHKHWSARTIDIDILQIDNLIIDNERLKVPHPFMFERDFVLIPLSEISDIKPKLHGDKVTKTDGSFTDFNLKMIACVDKNLGLGLNNQLLFHIDEDLKRFRSLTTGGTVIIGHKTFNSISKPLSNRRNIVLSHTINDIAGVEIANDFESLYHLLSVQENNFVIGGGEIYHQLLPYICEAYITFVNKSKVADVFLTNFDERDDFVCDVHEYRENFEFRHYQRRPVAF